MRLDQFIEQFVEPNTLIRLWSESSEKKGTHYTLEENDKVFMEHELLINHYYRGETVKGVTDIVVMDSHYPEAVNIVLKIC